MATLLRGYTRWNATVPAFDRDYVVCLNLSREFMPGLIVVMKQNNTVMVARIVREDGRSNIVLNLLRITFRRGGTFQSFRARSCLFAL